MSSLLPTTSTTIRLFPTVTSTSSSKASVQTHRGVSDVRITIEHMIAEGNWVAAHYTLRGIHSGELRGIPPTGKPVVLPGIVLSRILGSKIVEEWNLSDKLGLFQQLGALPARNQA